MDYLTKYYKNLAEELQQKCNKLYLTLNEVASPVQLMPGQGPGTLEGDPNYRFVGGVESAGDSVRPQLMQWNNNAQVWKTNFYNSGYANAPWNNWASWINALYQYWNNNAFWNAGMQDFMVGLFGDGYNYQFLPNGDILFTEEMKQIAYNCIQSMVQAGSQSPNQNASNAAAQSVFNYFQEQYGIKTYPWYNGEFAPFFTNYYLPGATSFPPTPPWQWNPGMGLPFANAPTVPAP